LQAGRRGKADAVFRLLFRGLPGHPIHPPLTDATIGTYTLATIGAVLDKLGIAPDLGARAWAFALLVGLILTVPTAVTGVVDWLNIMRGTPLFRTATAHLLAMVTATVFFLVAAVMGYSDGGRGVVETAPFAVTLAGFATLTLGGWLGGSIVFVHGMRVLNLVEEPTHRAVSPVPHPEQEAAEKG
jgi:uncharacterized membrane protein